MEADEDPGNQAIPICLKLFSPSFTELFDMSFASGPGTIYAEAIRETSLSFIARGVIVD